MSVCPPNRLPIVECATYFHGCRTSLQPCAGLRQRQKVETVNGFRTTMTDLILYPQCKIFTEVPNIEVLEGVWLGSRWILEIAVWVRSSIGSRAEARWGRKEEMRFFFGGGGKDWEL
jgi:hypothetical protein